MDFEKSKFHPEEDVHTSQEKDTLEHTLDEAQTAPQEDATQAPFTTAFEAKSTLEECAAQPEATAEALEATAESPEVMAEVSQETPDTIAQDTPASHDMPLAYGYQEAVNENMCTYHSAQAPDAKLYTHEPPSAGDALAQNAGAYEAPHEQASASTAYRAYNPIPEEPKKKRSVGKGVLLGLGGVAAACLIFVAGTAIGAAFQNDGTPHETAAGNVWDNSLPSVQISTAPDYDPDNYDVVNGLAGEEVYAKVNPSIVSVLATTSQGEASGSGVIMSESGYVITNQHVIDSASAVTIQLADGTQIPTKIIGEDAKTDLAVLKVDTDIALVAAEFGDSDELQPGEYAYAIGSPGGVTLANTITGGRISAINRDVTIDDRVMTLIQTDASINPGNSGGALINKYGQVVGITSAKLGISYYEGLGFAIPINSAKEVVDELIQTGYVTGRPAIGISGVNISEQKAKYNNVPQGVYVESMDENSSAAAAGMQLHDIITEVDGQEITTMDEINEIKESKGVGDTMEVRVYRMSTGKFEVFTITLIDEYELSSNQQEPLQEVPTRGEDGYSTYGYDQDPFSYFFGY